MFVVHIQKLKISLGHWLLLMTSLPLVPLETLDGHRCRGYPAIQP